MDIFTQSTTASLAIRLGNLSSATLNPETQHQLKEQAEIISLIQTFNLGVQNAFHQGGMHGLEPYTTSDGYVRMQNKYAKWRANGICELNLTLCDFLSMTLDTSNTENNPPSAVAYTFEKWVFVYENGEQKPTRGSVDRYLLQKVSGHWKVDSVVTYAAEA